MELWQPSQTLKTVDLDIIGSLRIIKIKVSFAHILKDAVSQSASSVNVWSFEIDQ